MPSSRDVELARTEEQLGPRSRWSAHDGLCRAVPSAFADGILLPRHLRRRGAEKVQEAPRIAGDAQNRGAATLMRRALEIATSSVLAIQRGIVGTCRAPPISMIW
jgi:hypothetical protein